MSCPARSMQLKEARTLVRFPGTDGELRELVDYADQVPRLGDLRAAYRRLWKLYVLTSEPDPIIRRELQTMCLAALPAGCTNVLRL